MDRLVRTPLSPLIIAWRRAVIARWRAMPRPPDRQIVYTTGPRELRILLIGGGIAAGYGTLVHELALAGRLGRRLTALSGRGTAIEITTGVDLEISDGPDLLSRTHPARFDVIVACFGVTESATLITEAEWRHALDAFLDAVKQAAAPDTHLFITAIPIVNGIPGCWGRLSRHRANALNVQSARVCGRRSDVTFVLVDPEDPLAPRPTPREAYESWANRIAPQILTSTVLSLSRDLTRRRLEIVDEPERQKALDRLGIIGAPRETKFEQLVVTARNLFQVAGAAIHLIDGDRQWVKASVGMNELDTPRDESICDYTIREPELLVIEDVQTDARFGGLAWTRGVLPIRFYAGYPLESPDGQRIGALCIVDSSPRSFSESDGAVLRDLALTAQSLIWRAAA